VSARTLEKRAIVGYVVRQTNSIEYLRQLSAMVDLMHKQKLKGLTGFGPEFVPRRIGVFELISIPIFRTLLKPRNDASVHKRPLLPQFPELFAKIVLP